MKETEWKKRQDRKQAERNFSCDTFLIADTCCFVRQTRKKISRHEHFLTLLAEAGLEVHAGCFFSYFLYLPILVAVTVKFGSNRKFRSPQRNRGRRPALTQPPALFLFSFCIVSQPVTVQTLMILVNPIGGYKRDRWEKRWRNARAIFVSSCPVSFRLIVSWRSFRENKVVDSTRTSWKVCWVIYAESWERERGKIDDCYWQFIVGSA